MRQWRRETMCDNCPFAEDGPGLFLRRSLAPRRWDEIITGLHKGQHFLCHKTTADAEDDDEGNEVRYPHAMICAGARYYQRQRGIVSDAEQIMERVEALESMLKQEGT